MLLHDAIDSEKAKRQSYFSLLKDRGVRACIEMAILVVFFFIINTYVFHIPYVPVTYIATYLFFTIYAIFRPKIIVKLRETLNVKPE